MSFSDPVSLMALLWCDAPEYVPLPVFGSGVGCADDGEGLCPCRPNMGLVCVCVRDKDH